MASVETSGPTGTRLPAQYRLFAQIVGAVIDPDGVVHDAVRDCTGRVLGATRTEHRHSRRCSGHADVTLAGPAESCSAHRPDSRRDAVVGGLVVQQLQRLFVIEGVEPGAEGRGRVVPQIDVEVSR